MSGLVEQLQADALDKAVALSTLLRKAKVTAMKLKLPEAVGWMDAELNGYEKRPPEYRVITGELKWWNPYRGWMPVGFENSKTAEHFQTWAVHESVGSLEATLGATGETFHLPMPPEVTTVLTKSLGVRVTSAICEAPRGAVAGILDRVRGLVLDWALELESAGITGEGLSFSPREQEAAKSASISIGTFHGNFNSGELSGAGARLHQGGTDNSTNITAEQSVFGEIETAVRAQVTKAEQRDQIIFELQQLRDAENGTTKLAAYQRLIAAGANHMTVLAPFLPALATWLAS